ncbi:MAG: hypothetical protein LUF32_02635 [Clostridiales bacterium]|nr:hypothetical protein [Clostridiales bacterium]
MKKKSTSAGREESNGRKEQKEEFIRLSGEILRTIKNKVISDTTYFIKGGKP